MSNINLLTNIVKDKMSVSRRPSYDTDNIMKYPQRFMGSIKTRISNEY